MEKRSTSVEKLKKQKIAFEKAMKNMTPYQTLLVKTFMAGVKAACGMSVWTGHGGNTSAATYNA